MTQVLTLGQSCLGQPCRPIIRQASVGQPDEAAPNHVGPERRSGPGARDMDPREVRVHSSGHLDTALQYVDSFYKDRRYATPSKELSNCSGSSWRLGAQAPYRSRLAWSAGALDHVLSPHTGSFHLYITGECFALPFSTKSSHFTTALPLLLSPLFLS